MKKTAPTGIRADQIKIENGTEKVEIDASMRAVWGEMDLAIGDGLMIKEPEGGVSDAYTIYEADGTTEARHALIVPKEAPVTTYPVWVGSTQVTSANKDDILGDGGKAKFDPETSTLTLDNPTVTGQHEQSIIYSYGIDLTVKGSAALSDTSAIHGISSIRDSGFGGVGGDLTIEGNISVEAGTGGINAADMLVISDGTVTTSGGITGIFASNIGITGGNVTATASGDIESIGIFAEDNIIVSGGEVTASAGKSLGTTAIFSNTGDITISGGTITAAAGEGGIYAYQGSVTVANGTTKVEADGGTVAVRGATGITIGDALMIKEPVGGTVEVISSGSTNIMNGSDIAHHALIVPKETHVTTWTVTFDSQGGSAVAAQTVNDGEKATKPADLTESGWTFDGWYQDATCSVAFDFGTAITADITLYAKWTKEAAPEEIVYTVVSGGNSTWTKGSSSGVTIVVKRNVDDDTCFSHFTGVQIDGTTLFAGDYEAKAGSTVITLKVATLQKFSIGSHAVTINFDDRSAATKLTVKAAPSPKDPTSPQTGDNSHMGLWITMMILSVMGLCGTALIGRKQRYISKH